MSNRNWVENTILGIIAFNIFVLAYVFLIPRTQFMIYHWGRGPEAITETPGAADTPNRYSKAYKVANQIRKVTKENSIILMPADNWEFGSNRSALIQRLYPRKVYFFGEKSFLELKNNLNPDTSVYAAAFSGDGAGLCFEKDARKLGETEFVLCKLKN